MKPLQCAWITFALLAVSAAPRAATLTPTIAPPSAPLVQSFYDYLLTPGTNIATDAAAQERFLAPSLRKLLAAATAAVSARRKEPGVEGPDPMLPDNGTFLDSWDPPTSCAATRPADRDGTGPVPVVCTWGPGTNYPGQSKKMAVTMERAGPGWRIAGIRIFESPFSRANDLEQELRAIIADAGGTPPESDAAGKPGIVARDGNASAMLVFTRDATFEQRWYAAPEQQAPAVSIDNLLRPGDRGFIYVVFNRPGVDASGIADLAVTIEITGPDGTSYGRFEHRPAMEPGFQPKPDLLYLAQPHVEVRIEDKDQPGVYKVRAVVEDRVRGAQLVTESTFVVDRPEKPGTPEKAKKPKAAR